MIAKLISGSTGDIAVTDNAFLSKVRVAGTANLAGAVQIKQGTTVLETLPIGTTPGTERDFAAGGAGVKFDANLGKLIINLANAADTVLVLFN
jgi:hypothetical protein